MKVFVWNRDRRAASSPLTPGGCHCPVGATCRQDVLQESRRAAVSSSATVL